MLYVILTIVLLVAAVTLLRIRIRFELSRDKRLMFVGLGRTGHEQDFVARVGRIRLFGVTVKALPGVEKKEGKPKVKPAREKKPKKKKPARKRSIGDFLGVAPGVFSAAANYLWSLVKSIKVEELDGEIEAGFESPDQTGQVFGYYQAALAMAPSVVGRLQFTPDWTGQSFNGSARVALAIPLYKIILRTMVLIFKLPLRKLIKLAIGKKKGDQDVQ